MKKPNYLKCTKTSIDTPFEEARNNVSLIVRRAVDRANSNLNTKINDLRHLMNDQLVELKYGKGYNASYLDDILLKASQF